MAKKKLTIPALGERLERLTAAIVADSLIGKIEITDIVMRSDGQLELAVMVPKIDGLRVNVHLADAFDYMPLWCGNCDEGFSYSDTIEAPGPVPDGRLCPKCKRILDRS